MLTAQWSPFRDLERMREAMDWLFDRSAPAQQEAAGRPKSRPFPVRITETDEGVVIHAVLPGFAPEQIEMHADQGRIMIHAHRPEITVDEEAKSIYDELWTGDLYRVITLPHNLDFDQAHASLELGVLTIRIPKTEQAKPKRIEVRESVPSLN